MAMVGARFCGFCGRDFYVTNYTAVVICTGLEYFGEENVPVFITFLLFYRHNMPIL